jgi:hypothetical protein
VHVDHHVELFLAGVRDLHVDDRTRVVDQIVEPVAAEAAPERLGEGCGKDRKGRHLGDVEREHRRCAAQRFDLAYQSIGFRGALAIGADDADTATGEVQRHAATEAAAGAGNKCNLLRHGYVPCDLDFPDGTPLRRRVRCQ